jgi:hypothetical protein
VFNQSKGARKVAVATFVTCNLGYVQDHICSIAAPPPLQKKDHVQVLMKGLGIVQEDVVVLKSPCFVGDESWQH